MSDAAALVAERSLGQDLGDLFISPGDAFESLLKKGQFWIPLVVWLALTYAFQAIWLSHLDVAEFLRRQAELAGKPVPAMPEAALGFVKIAMWVGAFVVVPIALFVIAGVYLLVFRAFMGTSVTFRQTLTVLAWSSLCVSLVSLPLTFGTMALKGDWNQVPQLAFQTSAALVLDQATAAKSLYALADSLDLFVAWTLFLLTTGFAVASRRSIGSAALGVVGPWGLYVLIKVGWAALMG
jgi:hypothetical protein